MPRSGSQATIDAIAGLAEEIARANPECADKALQILDLVRALERSPDLAAIEDAIDAGTDGGLTDTEVRSASREVARTMREET
ncbi:MAG TPA: hypothetical protein VF601_11615 [Beijerinckiaceae bacterium]|jgi:hypothetical protein